MKQHQWKLSQQERKVYELVAQGFPNKAIATQLSPPIRVSTVSSYIRRIMAKTRTHSRAHMVAVVMAADQAGKLTAQQASGDDQQAPPARGENVG